MIDKILDKYLSIVAKIERISREIAGKDGKNPTFIAIK